MPAPVVSCDAQRGLRQVRAQHIDLPATSARLQTKRDGEAARPCAEIEDSHRANPRSRMVPEERQGLADQALGIGPRDEDIRCHPEGAPKEARLPHDLGDRLPR
jgi:hypothetical protein